MSAALERVLGAFRTVKASGAEEREGARLHDAAAAAWRAGLRADRWQAAERLDGIARSLEGGVVVTTVPMVGIRTGGPPQQPVLATYEDARSGGMPTDYVAALVASGARWVLTTDRYGGSESAPEPRMPPYFTRARTYDFDVRSLADWDRPKNVVLWRRTDP